MGELDSILKRCCGDVKLFILNFERNFQLLLVIN